MSRLRKIELLKRACQGANLMSMMKVCDRGKPRRATAVGCDDCLNLGRKDGREYVVIRALEQRGRSSLMRIGSASGLGHRCAAEAISRLIAEGKVRKVTEDLYEVTR